MTIRKAFCSAASKGFGTVYIVAITATGSLVGARIPALVLRNTGFQMEPADVFAAALLTSVAGGVLGYAYAKATLHDAHEKIKRKKRVYAIARGWAQPHKRPTSPTA